MERIWSNGPADVKQVHRAISDERKITLNTVQSTMERLFRKDMLTREKVSHAYVYSAKLTREQMTAQIMGTLVGRLAGGRTEPMLSAFVDLADRAGDATLARLQHLVAERRKGRKG